MAKLNEKLNELVEESVEIIKQFIKDIDDELQDVEYTFYSGKNIERVFTLPDNLIFYPNMAYKVVSINDQFEFVDENGYTESIDDAAKCLSHTTDIICIADWILEKEKENN